MTNLIIHINQMFDNEDQNQDQILDLDIDQDLDQENNQEILNLYSQIPNQDIEVQEIPKKSQHLKRKKHYI